MRRLRGLAAVVAAGSVLLSTGCASGTDEEMTPKPRRTVTATVSPTATPAPQAPDVVPTGRADVDPTDPGDLVWAQGTRLHLRGRVTDLTPYVVDAFVVVRGGIYVLSDDRVWFTDLTRVRDTGLAFVSSISTDASGSRLRVRRTYPGGSDVLAYATGDGREVPGRDVRAVTGEQRLGRRVTVDVAGDRVRVRTGTGGAVEARQGSGDLGVAVTSAAVPVPYDAASGRRVRFRGLPAHLDLAGWVGPSAFYAIALADGRPRSVVVCDRRRGACRDLGRAGEGPIVFSSGA